MEQLDEAACLELIAAGGVGRLAYSGRYGLVVLPVNFRLFEGTVVFRTVVGSPLDTDLRTGIADAEYIVAFEVDEFDIKAKDGWSVLIQGSAHHVDTAEEREAVEQAGLETWPGGQREAFLRVIPSRITGRRIRRG